jgi:hypothetical protein
VILRGGVGFSNPVPPLFGITGIQIITGENHEGKTCTNLLQNSR